MRVVNGVEVPAPLGERGDGDHSDRTVTTFAFVPSNKELDADQYGMLLSLAAGYDPYGAAGALAKLSMASGDAALVDQNFDNLSGDLHGSFNDRLALIFQTMKAICSRPENQSFCKLYKNLIHPDLPSISPLSVGGQLR